MGRVSDAMWRAGQHEGETAAAGLDAAGSDDMPFVSGEAGEFVSAKLEETDREATSPAGFTGVQDRRAAGTATTRWFRSSGRAATPVPTTDVRIVDVLGILFRHRWLMAIVMAVCRCGGGGLQLHGRSDLRGPGAIDHRAQFT